MGVPNRLFPVVACVAMCRKKLGLGLLVLSFVTGFTSGAAAITDEERAAARAAAGQGADAFDAGKWADAVELFSRAEALVHSPAHLLFIARSQLKLGQWVKAYENFNRIKREPITPDSPPATKRSIDEATAELAKLEPQLPYVAAKVKNPSGDVQVTMDGVKVPPLLVGLMRPVDPGQHQFQATNGQLSSDVAIVDVKPTTKQTVELELKNPVPAGAAPLAAAAPAAAAPPPSPTADSAPPAEGGGTNPLRIVSYSAMGLGVAGVVVGTIFLVKSGSTQSEADDLCPQAPCDPALKDKIDGLDSDAASEQTIGAIGLGVGGALLATGVTLFFVSGKKSASAEYRPGITPFVGWRSAGITGRF
jgi:hypothetical protein